MERGIQILRNYDGRTLLEEDIEDWLDRIYAEPVRSEWLKNFEVSAREFREACLDTLVGLNGDTDLRDLFYRMFDGIEVLPEKLTDDFRELLDKEPLRTGELLVNLRWSQFCALKKRGLVKEHESLEGVYIVTVPYSCHFGLEMKAVS